MLTFYFLHNCWFCRSTAFIWIHCCICELLHSFHYCISLSHYRLLPILFTRLQDQFVTQLQESCHSFALTLPHYCIHLAKISHWICFTDRCMHFAALPHRSCDVTALISWQLRLFCHSTALIWFCYCMNYCCALMDFCPLEHQFGAFCSFLINLPKFHSKFANFVSALFHRKTLV